MIHIEIMRANKFLRIILILFILALNIGCDQVSKSFIRHKMEIYDEYTFLHRHITIRRVENIGAFLSLGDSLSRPLKIILLDILPLIAITFGLAFILIKTNLNRISLAAIILIIGGGAGNLYDRMVHGSVTDFMHINFVLFQTGVFNVADMSITTGALIILIHSFFKKKTEVEGNQI